MQQTLFDTGPRRMRRAATQNDAWKAIAETLPEHRRRVLEFIGRRGAWGATRQEIADGTGMKLATVCGRANDLLGGKDGRQYPALIYQTDETRGVGRCKGKVLRVKS